MSDGSDDMSEQLSDGRPRRCPGGFLSWPSPAMSIIWSLYTIICFAVSLTLIILGALINDPEKCKVVQVPIFMLITGGFGLALTFMGIPFLWNINKWSLLLHQILIFGSILYGSIVLQNLSADKASLRYCDDSVCAFAFSSFYIPQSFLFSAFIIKTIYYRFF